MCPQSTQIVRTKDKINLVKNACTKLVYEDLTEKIIGALYEVHKVLGPGFSERIYHNAMLKELQLRRLRVETEKLYKVAYKGEKVGEYRCDIVVENKVILELKAVKQLTKDFESQLLSYLKATGLRVGLLVNFSKSKLEYKRFIY